MSRPDAAWGDGPPRWLMLHCMMGQSAMWAPVAAGLDGTSWALDLPGHGAAPGPGDASYHTATMTRAVTCLEGVEGPVTLVGHSFGATVALRIGIERPDLVSRLVLIEPVFFAVAHGTDTHRDYLKAFAPAARAMAEGRAMEAAEAFTGYWNELARWPRLPAAIKARLAEQVVYVADTVSSIEEDGHGMVPRLGGLDRPVTLVEGAQSPPIIGAIQARLAERLPRPRRVVIDGAGHMVVATNPAEVAAAIAGAEAG